VVQIKPWGCFPTVFYCLVEVINLMQEKYGFIYIWFDRKYKRYYVGSHWGTEDDGYICSSRWMRNSYNKRSEYFKRRIISRVYTNRSDLLIEEQRWLTMMKDNELATHHSTLKKRETVRYYNVSKQVGNPWHKHPEHIKTVGQKISAAKRGKNTGPRDPSVGQKISEAKKGKALTEAHKEALRGIKKKPHSDEWKEANSKMMKERHARTNVEITCPHCGVVGKSAGMKRWHFDNCRSA
jgi:hypothetical protein